MPGELENDAELGKKLSNIADVYVFDAFGTSHRAHASTYGAIKASEVSCAGLLLENETNALQQAISSKSSPMLSIVGGSKVSTKINLLNNLIQKFNCVVIGGAMANTFLLSKDKTVGKSLVEKDLVDVAKDIQKKANQLNCKLILPLDLVCGKSIEDKAPIECDINDVSQDLSLIHI